MRIGIACVAGLGLLLAGCGEVLSDAPMSDASNSVLDERLIGAWELVPGDARDAGKDEPRIYVGKLKGSKSALEAVTIDLDKDKRINVQRYRVFTTRIGEASFLSVTNAKEKDYGLVRYTLDGEGHLHLQDLDEEKVASEIQTRKIAGHVKEHPKKKGPLDFRVGRYAEVRLTAETETLRAWILKNPGVWTPLDELVGHFRKLVLELENK